MKTQLLAIALIASLTVIGCSLVGTPKTQRELDIDACTYGVVVPNNIRPDQRDAYVKNRVAGCMRVKGYRDEAPQP